MDKTLFILIGVPGSGKSTYAKKLSQTHPVKYGDLYKYILKGSNYDLFNQRPSFIP